MPDFKIHVIRGGAESSVSARKGESILSALREAEISELHAPCGGNGTCRQCNVKVTGLVRSLSDNEQILDANDTILLACRWSPTADISVEIPDSGSIEVVIKGVGDIAPSGNGLGVAADIGTTTVAVFLYDLSSGKALAVKSGRNAQRPFGADVLSRIQYSSSETGLQKLTGLIRGQIDAAIDSTCESCGRSRAEITRVSIAANTVMEHIFAGLSPVTIGVAPFKTLSLFGKTEPAQKYFSGFASGALLYLAPAIAGYVGGDISAGLYGSGAWKDESCCLFIDIGTNGEMALGDKNGFICCATAAGPAFEGAEIDCGMDGSTGAISKLWYENGEIGYSVIGDIEASGICGSGLIDALAVMLSCGAILESGRMTPHEDAPKGIRSRIKRADDGKLRFYLTDKVYISAQDVRSIQLAKSAIRAGAETLLELRGKKYDDISRLYIAGGFGAYMDIDSACAIGLLPPALKEKSVHAGNTAGYGAALALAAGGASELAGVTDRCEYLELSSSKLFMEKYIEYMVFDEFEGAAN